MNPTPGPAEESEDLNLCSDDLAFMESLLRQLPQAESSQAVNSLESKFDEILDGAEDALLGHAGELNFSGPESRNTLRYMLTLSFAEKIFRDYLRRKEKQAEAANPPFQWTREDELKMLKEKLEFVVGEEVESWNSQNHDYPYNCSLVANYLRRSWGFSPPELWHFESAVKDKANDYRQQQYKAAPHELRVLWKGNLIANISLDTLKQTSVPIYKNLLDVAEEHILSWFTHEQFADLRQKLSEDFPNLLEALNNSPEWNRTKLFSCCKKLLAQRIPLLHLDVVVQTLLEHSPTDAFGQIALAVRKALAPHTCQDYQHGMTVPVLTLAPPLVQQLKTNLELGHPIGETVVKRILGSLKTSQRPLLVEECLRVPLMTATRRWGILTEIDIPTYLSAEPKGVLHFGGLRKSHLSKRRALRTEPSLPHRARRLHRKRTS